MSYLEERVPITFTPLHCKSISIGPQSGIYLKAKENIHIGHNSGFETRTSNNILIGNDIDGNGNQIIIGNDRQKQVKIGHYDLERIDKYITFLHNRILSLEKFCDINSN